MLMRVPPDMMPEQPPRWRRDPDNVLFVLLAATFVLTVLIVVYALYIG